MCIIHGQASLKRAVIVFQTAENAASNVAGLPAAARALREAALAGVEQCWIVAEPGWRPAAPVREELARLAGGMPFAIAGRGELSAVFPPEGALLVCGEKIVDAATIRAALSGPVLAADGLAAARSWDETALAALGGCDCAAELDAAARRIVAATAKPGDGIVSRTLNRPISQAISRLLLNWPAIRPMQVTWLTGLLSLVMVACLLSGSNSGLIAGAILFQVASIADGIDGEIARATFRTSSRGAMADSLVDAATNIGFIGGVTINLWIQGSTSAAMVGAAGLAMMALGLLLIGIRARRSARPFTFNGVKDRVGKTGSRLMQWLTWLTMRDFYAFAAVLFVVSGHAAAGLIAFAVVAAGWLAVVLAVLRRKAA